MPDDIDTPEEPPRKPPSQAHIESVAYVREQHYARLVAKMASGLPGARQDRFALADLFASVAFDKALYRCDSDSVAAITTYVYTTATNIRKNYYRHSSIVRRLEPVLKSTLEIDFTPRSPESLYLEEELCGVLLDRIDALRPLHRLAFVLHVWGESSVKDIVPYFASLGFEVDERTIYRYIRTARDACRETLKAYNKGPEDGTK